MDVVAVVGVAGSPSCGVHTTVDMRASLRAIAACPHQPTTRAWMTGHVVEAATHPGQGLFMESLSGELRRRGLAVPWDEFLLSVPPERPLNATESQPS